MRILGVPTGTGNIEILQLRVALSCQHLSVIPGDRTPLRVPGAEGIGSQVWGLPKVGNVTDTLVYS